MRISVDLVRQFMEQKIPFNRYLGVRVDEIRPGYARLAVPFRDDLVGDVMRPAVHGGVLSALADTAGGAALWTCIEPFDRLSTIDLRVDYLRPCPLEEIACEAEVVRLGNRVGVADMRLFASGSPDEVIAAGKGVYSVRRTGAGGPRIDWERGTPRDEADGPRGAGEGEGGDAPRRQG